jgi:hypothetical protein
VVNGVRRQIAGQNLQVAPAVWHALIFKIVGEMIEVWFNAARLIQVRDQTLLEPGKVGMWTKADSLTHFAEMRIESRQAGADRVITDL